MPLKNLVLEIGGVGMSVNFSTPTTRRVENIMVGSGGTYLAMLNIGNSDFEKFALSGGGCAFDLDFHGGYSASNHDIYLVLAADNLIGELPLEAGKEVQAYTMMAPLMVKGDRWHKVIFKPFYKEYITDNYGMQATTLDLNICATTSSVIIDRN